MKSRQRWFAQRVGVLSLGTLSLVIGLTSAAPVGSQKMGHSGGPGGPPPGGRWGGPGHPGGPGGNFRPSSKMRLGDSIAALADLEKSKSPLTRAQAKQIVGLLRPWQKKANMSESEGQSLLAKLTGLLTAAQQNQWHKLMAAHRPHGFGPDGPGGRGGPGGPPPGGHGGPSPDGMGGPPPDGMGSPPPDGHGGPHDGHPGGPPPGGPNGHGGPPSQAQMKQMQAFFKTFNPLATVSPVALKSMPPPMRERQQQRTQAMTALMAHLAQKAGSK